MTSQKTMVVIAHDIRSAHNVGSIFRTCEGLGVQKLYLTGYTPYPTKKNDPRLPHLSLKTTKQINKTALNAEKNLAWQQKEDIKPVIEILKNQGFEIVALEQAKNSVNLTDFKPCNKTAIILGREVEGIAPEILELTDRTVEIPMQGSKESFNVVQAFAMTAYTVLFER